MSITRLCDCAPDAVLFMESKRSADHQGQHHPAGWAGGHPAAHGSQLFPLPTIQNGSGTPFDALPDAFSPERAGNLPEVRAKPLVLLSTVTGGSGTAFLMLLIRTVSCC